MKARIKNIWFWGCLTFVIPWFVFFLLGNGLLLRTDVPHTTNFWYILLAVLSLAAMRLLSKKKLDRPFPIIYELILTVGLYVFYTFVAPV